MNRAGTGLPRAEIVGWLTETDPARVEGLYRAADETRRARVGDDIFLRGLVEFSNVCERRCLYCGLRAPNAGLGRYTMTEDEILDCARQSREFGYGTVVLQSGENRALPAEWMAGVVRRIKAETGLAVTLSLGERPDEDLRQWREAGADRYLLRFETGNRELYERIHPPRPGERSDRVAMLRRLRALGYETGSGVMTGIPGQTFEDLASDILLFRELDLDMIGIGPFIAHPQTPLGRAPARFLAPPGRQVPNNEEMVYRVMALARLCCPRANIPSTTALATLNLECGREQGLSRGANIIMPIMTPTRYRASYEIYPSRACQGEGPSDCYHCLNRRIAMIGRTVGKGPGTSPAFTGRDEKNQPIPEGHPSR